MSSIDQDHSVQVQIKIVDDNKLSKQCINIRKDEIKEILSEIDELDKEIIGEILGIGKSDVKRNIIIAEFKTKIFCLYLNKMSVWIPVTELGELRNQLMESIYNDYVICQISAARDNKYKQAKEILKKYDEWATAVKEQKEALRIEEAFKKSKELYQKVKKEEELYNSEIKKIVNVFTALIPDLACFAGCRTSESYPDIAASLENKRRHLKAYLYRNKDVLDDLKEIPSFPDLETMQADSDMEQNGVEEDEVNDGIPEEFRGFIEELCNFFERQGNNPDNGNFDEAFDNMWNGDKAYRAFVFFDNGLEEAKRGTLLIQEEEKEIGEKKRIYRTEAEKIRKRILLYDKHWSYARLFCMAYSIVKEIDEYPEGEMDADWCRTISERLYKMLENFNKESSKYRFQWISYNDKEYIEFESIKVDFVVGEASWPGLYLCYDEDGNYQKHLNCVTPGSVLEV